MSRSPRPRARLLAPVAIAVAAIAVGSSCTYFFDDQSSYSVTTNPASVASQLSTKGWEPDFPQGHVAIAAWPADPARRSFMIEYQHSEDYDHARYYLDSDSVTEAWVEWDEYRSPGFDFGTTKDWVFNLFDGDTGHTGDLIHQYGGFGTEIGQTSGLRAATHVGLNIQGLDIATRPGDDNTIVTAPFAMQRATPYHVRLHLKLNADGASDGEAQLWVDGDLVLQALGQKFYRDGTGPYFIRSFQLGMSATNGPSGTPFDGVSKIYRRNVNLATP